MGQKLNRWYTAPDFGWVPAYHRLGSGGEAPMLRMTAAKFEVSTRCKVSEVGLWVNTAGQAGSIARIGIYADDGSTNPATLLGGNGGPVSIASTGHRKVAATGIPYGANLILDPGVYWAAVKQEVSGSTAPVYCCAFNCRSGIGSVPGSATEDPFVFRGCYYVDMPGTQGQALPSTFPANAPSGDAPIVVSMLLIPPP